MLAHVGEALLGSRLGSGLGLRGEREDSCVLPFIEPRQQYDLAIGKLERVMIGVKRAFVDLAKDRNGVAGIGTKTEGGLILDWRASNASSAPGSTQTATEHARPDTNISAARCRRQGDRIAYSLPRCMSRLLAQSSIAHESKNVFYVGRNNLYFGGAVPRGADLYGLANYDRGLVGAEMGELDRPRRRRWPRYSRI